MNLSKNTPNSNRIRVFFMQNWCRSDKSAYGWPISSISSIHAKQYALEISCFAFLNIVNVSIDVSLTQNALNDLFIVFFSCVFWLRTKSYRRWSVSIFSKTCYTSKTEAEISRFVIQEGRMILPRFLAANIPNLSSTLPVNYGFIALKLFPQDSKE